MEGTDLDSDAMVTHLIHMRTTIDIPDHLLIAAKQKAAARNTSVTNLVVDSLRRYLAEENLRAPPSRDLPVIRDARPVDGVDLDDTSVLWEIP
jgi:hypothetical protein